jgi:hypothetical protein
MRLRSGVATAKERYGTATQRRAFQADPNERSVEESGKEQMRSGREEPSETDGAAARKEPLPISIRLVWSILSPRGDRATR